MRLQGFAPSFSAPLAPRAAIGVLAAALFTLAPPPTSLPAMLPSAHAALSEGEKEVRTEGGVMWPQGKGCLHACMHKFGREKCGRAP